MGENRLLDPKSRLMTHIRRYGGLDMNFKKIITERSGEIERNCFQQFRICLNIDLKLDLDPHEASKCKMLLFWSQLLPFTVRLNTDFTILAKCQHGNMF